MWLQSKLTMDSILHKNLRPQNRSLLTFFCQQKLLWGLAMALFMGFALPVAAQDTLWARNEGNKFFFRVKAKRNDNVHTIAARFHVPIMEISRYNQITLQSEFSEGAIVNVPVGKYNLQRGAFGNTLPLYYRVKEGDHLQTLSSLANVSQAALQNWNQLSSQDLTPGQIILIGWITDESLFVEKENLQVTAPSNTSTNTMVPSTSTHPPVTTVKNHTPEEPAPVKPNAEPAAYKPLDETQYFDSVSAAMEQQFEEETLGLNVTEEAGAAVFFDYKKVKPGFFYAFHNTAAPGSFIRIYNPASEQTVYAKVIGPIPPLKEYEKCIVALSGNASRALGTQYKTVFCKVTFR